MHYARMRHRLVAVAFVAGPLLMLASAAALLSGVGRDEGVTGYGSTLEGLIGFFGFVVLVPVFISLADLLGTHRPRLAIVAAITGLIGFAGGGVMQMTMRVMNGEFLRLGVSESVFEQAQAELEAGSSILLVLIATGPLVPLTSFLLGIGFLLTGRFRVQGWLLATAGVSFLSGQFFLVATDLTYTLALALWAAALIPMGVRMLREAPAGEPSGVPVSPTPAT